MSIVDVASYLLIINSLCDFVFAVSILVSLAFPDFCKCISDVYLCLFRLHEDRTNPMVSVMLALVLFQCAWSRYFAGVFFRFNLMDGVFSYLIQILLVMYGFLLERVDITRGVLGILICLVCTLLVLWGGVVDRDAIH